MMEGLLSASQGVMMSLEASILKLDEEWKLIPEINFC